MQNKIGKLTEIGVKFPIMQAGMPGISRAELVGAVAKAGGIGTLGLLDVSIWESEIARAKSLAEGKPICVNLLLPFTRRKHIDIAIEQKVAMTSLFWGDKPEIISRLKDNDIFVFQQVGSIGEAAKVIDYGVDAVILQGKEAGGHVRADEYLDELLPGVIEVSKSIPVFAAGGIYGAEDVKRVVSLGASGISTGTRFLLSDESSAHDAFKHKLVSSNETVLTKLFGMGWSDTHRVATNAATRKWCDQNGEIPAWLKLLNSSFAFSKHVLPLKSEIARFQNPRIPFFTPSSFVKEHSERLLECTALYAGERIYELSDVLPVNEIVADLAAGLTS